MKITRKLSILFAAAAVTMTPLALTSAAQAADVAATLSPGSLVFTENAPTPAFTVTTPALSAPSAYTQMSLYISKNSAEAGAPPVLTYWTLTQACPTMNSNIASCGINSLKVNGVAVSTGVQAQTQTNSISLRFSNAVDSGSTVSISLNAGVFTAGAAATYSLVFSPNTPDPANTDRAVVSLTSVASGGGGGGEPTTPSASITLGAAQGQLVAGSSVAIVASGLQAAAPYSVIVESDPQLLTPADATATNGAVNTTVTLPSNLGAGWHTLTFSSTAADGSVVTSVLYFEISSTGTLLGTSTTKPATLAQTGFDDRPLIALAAALLIMGASTALLARRRRMVL